MIFKHYEIQKIDININNILLFYGKNQGYKESEILKLIKSNKDRSDLKYDEKEIINNPEIIYDNVLSNSLFENKKILIIKRASDKLFNIITDLLGKKIEDILLIIDSENLEKKSKLRSLFEKDKKLICIPFYEDDSNTISKLANNFFKENKIKISNENINLVTSKCGGDRIFLKNELEKILLFNKSGKKITTDSILKLINLSEEYNVNELVNNCLAKNKNKTTRIINENNFNNEDCIIIVRTFLLKLKKLIKLIQNYKENNDINKTILNSRPPIFWKDKEITKQQIVKWEEGQLNKLIYDVMELELQVKRNKTDPINLVCDFILKNAA